MKCLITILTVFCIALVMVAGCTTPVEPDTTPETTAPTATPTVLPDLRPQPTDVVPLYQQVSIQISKNTVATDPWISVVFAGGGGQSYVVSMQATVIRSDGGIETEIAQSPGIQTTLMFAGTTRDDRAIVNVTYTDGMTYTVKDELVPFQNINP
ncbi:MAG: hypothetical protein ACP5NU_00525 [Methanomicrobiales archaeon]|jgi:hypothetical protein|nr:hypothetical protein [Burkholderiaceae bacterium]NLH25804.1 hypothetical protein [Methanomicrobiales archaeon]HNB02739.1 hypothetical protein [Methanoregulaceae archaeon]HNI41508.1 hypothetical protein [Methanoregulaceae archaeon]HNO08123.1 hypothetical protein [Methanoregulaceae archaeon]